MVLEDLPTTIDNIGVEEFAELLKENGIMDELSNMTIFIPSNEAVEDFRHDLQHLNSVDNERNTYDIDDGLSYRLFFVRSTYFFTPINPKYKKQCPVHLIFLSFGFW